MNENPSTLSNTDQLSHENISRKAKELWENYGRPEGRDEEIWFEAERALSASTGNAETGREQRPVDMPMKNTAASTGNAAVPSGSPGGRGAQPRGGKPGKR